MMNYDDDGLFSLCFDFLLFFINTIYFLVLIIISSSSLSKVA